MASPAVGVGHCDKEQALSPVRRPDVAGAEHSPFARVPGPLEIADNVVQPARNERRHVFDDHAEGTELADDAGKLAPESRARPLKSGPRPGERDVLAGESSAENIRSRESCRSGSSDIGHAPVGLGPVPHQHVAAERIRFDLPKNGTEPRPFEAELEPPDAREERAEGPPAIADVAHASRRSMNSPGSAF